MSYRFTPKQARLYAGLTLEEMADKMGLSRSTICDYESCKTKMSIPVIHMWAQVTGVAIDDIFLPCDSTISMKCGKDVENETVF